MISCWSRSTESITALKLRATSVTESIFIIGLYQIESDSTMPSLLAATSDLMLGCFNGSRSLCSITNWLSAHRRGALGAVQLAVRAQDGRQVSAADRRYRPATLDGGVSAFNH